MRGKEENNRHFLVNNILYCTADKKKKLYTFSIIYKIKILDIFRSKTPVFIILTHVFLVAVHKNG